MTIAAFTSFKKSWTGKTVLSVMTALAFPRRPVCIIDCGGGCSTAFGVSDQPGLMEVCRGEEDLGNVVLEVKISVPRDAKGSRIVSGARSRVWVLPYGRGEIGVNALIDGALWTASVVNSYADIIMDLPAYRNGSLDPLLEDVDVAVIVTNPDPLSIRAVLKYERLEALLREEVAVIPVLNRVRGSTPAALGAMLRDVGEVTVIPFDPALGHATRDLPRALQDITDDTLESIIELSERISKGEGTTL